jgi:hypothetical protein
MIESTRCKCGKLPYDHAHSTGRGTYRGSKTVSDNLKCPGWSPQKLSGYRIDVRWGVVK